MAGVLILLATFTLTFCHWVFRSTPTWKELITRYGWQMAEREFFIRSEEHSTLSLGKCLHRPAGTWWHLSSRKWLIKGWKIIPWGFGMWLALVPGFLLHSQIISNPFVWERDLVFFLCNCKINKIHYSLWSTWNATSLTWQLFLLEQFTDPFPVNSVCLGFFVLLHSIDLSCDLWVSL